MGLCESLGSQGLLNGIPEAMGSINRRVPIAAALSGRRQPGSKISGFRESTNPKPKTLNPVLGILPMFPFVGVRKGFR